MARLLETRYIEEIKGKLKSFGINPKLSETGNTILFTIDDVEYSFFCSGRWYCDVGSRRRANGVGWHSLKAYLEVNHKIKETPPTDQAKTCPKLLGYIRLEDAIIKDGEIVGLKKNNLK